VSDGTEPPTYDDGFDPYEGLADLTGKEPLADLEDPGLPPATPPRSPLLTGLILGLLLVVLSIAIFNLTRDDETAAGADPTDTTAAASGTTATDGTSTETTEDTSPTDNSTTTTTEAVAVFDPYAAVGNPILPADLKLETGGIGEIRLGTPAAEAVGQIIASLGDPSSDSGPIPATAEYGADCADRQARIVKFGALAAIVIIDADGTETFAGYRLDLTYDGASTSTAADLETLSGFKLGNSVVDLRRIYDGFDVQLVSDPDLGRIFELRSGNTGNLLLWGPVTETGNEGTDTIVGIYSVDASVTFC
jgi:hypothetical protein